MIFLGMCSKSFWIYSQRLDMGYESVYRLLKDHRGKILNPSIKLENLAANVHLAQPVLVNYQLALLIKIRSADSKKRQGGC